MAKLYISEILKRHLSFLRSGWIVDCLSSSSRLLTSLSLVRTGCSLSELLTTYCNKASSLPPLWLFPIKADCPKPDDWETRATDALKIFMVRTNPASTRPTNYQNKSNEEDHFTGRLHGVLDRNQAAFAFVQSSSCLLCLTFETKATETFFNMIILYQFTDNEYSSRFVSIKASNLDRGQFSFRVFVFLVCCICLNF